MPPPRPLGPPSCDKSGISVILAHFFMGKLNFERSINSQTLPNLLNLLLVAAHAVAPPAPWPQWQRGGPRGHSNPTFATFATLGVATTATPFSNLKSGQTKHIAASWCITQHQRGQIGPMRGVFAPVGTKYPTYCSRCAHLAGSNQSGSWQGAHAKCEDGRTQFSQPTRWAIIFIALGAPG